MTPDMKRLCEIVIDTLPSRRLDEDDAYALVRNILEDLKGLTGETEGYREGLWSRRNVEALVRDILTDAPSPETQSTVKAG